MNAFRQLMRAAGSNPPIGTWISSASPIVAEAMGHAGFDWGVVDMEHAPLDMMHVLQLLQALGNTQMVAVVRVPWNDAVMVKRVLDAGATTVLFPFVQNAAEAAARGGRHALPAAGTTRHVGHEPGLEVRHRAQLPEDRRRRHGRDRAARNAAGAGAAGGHRRGRGRGRASSSGRPTCRRAWATSASSRTRR